MSTQRCDRAPDLPSQPFPGDLYLDPHVPLAQRVRVGQGRWRAEATHVWTGTGWTRLVAGQVRLVPSAGPAHRRPARPAVLAVADREPTLFDGPTGDATVVELRPSSTRAERHPARWAPEQRLAG